MYFSTDRITSLSSLERAARIHVIGVAGIAMSQLAVKLQQLGFKVSGSDKEFYNPGLALLESAGIETKQGYLREHIGPDIDLVVIGNAVMRDNPEVLAVEELQLSYSILPALLAELLLTTENRIVVCGTHGKFFFTFK